ncbi:MAG: alpha/beta fold hydrolase [Clostridia bacterium]|nr:alpha/beta fold hydrolase [Clostridia bacterium]
MKFQTFGNKNNKAVLLIHTLFTSSDFFAPVTQFLAKDYFVIVPTLSGHYENSTFISTEDEIRQIKEFLSENNVVSLYAVAGFSLGGNIAYEFFCNNAVMTEKAVIDSAPLFNFPKFIKKHFLKNYTKCLNRIKSGEYDTARELNKHFNGMGEYQKDIAPIVSQESLNSLVESCYNIKVYKLSRDVRNKVTFIYGSKDIARLCKGRLKKYHIHKMKGYGHCGFYRENPVEWAKQFIL